MSYSKEDIIRMVKEEDVEFIRLQFTDIFGQLKNVAITASQIEKAVNDQIMFDGSSIEGFTRVNESDQYLFPDRSSFAIFPWRPAQGRVARLICDVYDTDGTPFVGDPRGVLRRVVRKARDMGFDAFNIGPELEFFLFETDEEGRATTRTGDQAGYFDLGPLDQGESTRREICMHLEEMGFETINDFCGKALPNIFRHNDLSRAYKLYSQPDAEKCVGCGRCVAVCADSAYSAIHLDENRKAVVDKEKCDGCGLCTQVCPVSCMTMEHR